ncbi:MULTISPECIES: hypothetical protein [Rhizobium]|uniref:Uncharacterized protein n=1 Tax=Rhizobium paranaense TaxID=1650438 RepID=A0A7W8XSN7_9HYPH|nr:hypothetical protein [Rhizobium paranaense]MBB5574614.1 hypothetical protein [Rhizobium paranaense]
MIKPNDSSHWVLKPRTGLGNISFGMDRNAVNAIAAYGAVTGSRDSNPIPEDEATAFLRTLGVPDSDITAALGKQAEFVRPNVLTEARATGLVLEYDETGLFQILADIRADKLNYDGRFIFREPPLDIIKHLAAALRERPIIFENEVVFANNLIFLFEFVKVSKDGPSYLDGSRADRTIIWRPKPRDMGEDLSKYKPMDL